jgi:hypothetical protein
MTGEKLRHIIMIDNHDLNQVRQPEQIKAGRLQEEKEQLR